MIDKELQHKKPFPAVDHKERSLPGGKRWFFIPWQKIKDRLDEACPDWQVTYSDPVIAGDLVVVRCKLTLCGVTREGVGNSDAYKEKNKSGGYSYGSPIEARAADDEQKCG